MHSSPMPSGESTFAFLSIRSEKQLQDLGNPIFGLKAVFFGVESAFTNNCSHRI